LAADHCDKQPTKNIEEAEMLKHAATAVGALTTLALATTSEAASRLPAGSRQHQPITFTMRADPSTAPRGLTQWSNTTPRSGQGFLRSMDAGATGHHATVPTGSVRFRIDGSSANAAPPGCQHRVNPYVACTDRFQAPTNTSRMLLPAVKAIREAAPGRRISPSIMLQRLAVPRSAGMHHGFVNRFSQGQGHRLRF
jgi:hypothetical protein